MSEPVALKARETFFVLGSVVVTAGEVRWSDDPVVEGREHLFEPVAPERATANPGELRTVAPRKKKKTTGKAK